MSAGIDTVGTMKEQKRKASSREQTHNFFENKSDKNYISKCNPQYQNMPAALPPPPWRPAPHAGGRAPGWSVGRAPGRSPAGSPAPCRTGWRARRTRRGSWSCHCCCWWWCRLPGEQKQGPTGEEQRRTLLSNLFLVCSGGASFSPSTSTHFSFSKFNILLFSGGKIVGTHLCPLSVHPAHPGPPLPPLPAGSVLSLYGGGIQPYVYAEDRGAIRLLKTEMHKCNKINGFPPAAHYQHVTIGRVGKSGNRWIFVAYIT